MPYLIALILIAIGSVGFFFSGNTVKTNLAEQSPEATIETTATSSREVVAILPDDGNPTEQPQDEPSAAPPPTGAPSKNPPPTPTPTPAPATTFKNGTYSSDISYRVPESSYTIHVSLTVTNDTVTASNISFDGRGAGDPRSRNFVQNYKSYVVGKSLSSISLSRVGGASLTTSAFNKAVNQIETEART